MKGKVTPVLVAALVSDSSSTDPTSGKKALIGIFDHISVGKFPTSRPLSLYFKITDAEGDYDLDVRFIQVATGERLAGVESNTPITIKNRLNSFDMVFPLPEVPFPAAGRYEFQIWLNNMFVGSTSIQTTLRKARRSK